MEGPFSGVDILVVKSKHTESSNRLFRVWFGESWKREAPDNQYAFYP